MLEGEIISEDVLKTEITAELEQSKEISKTFSPEEFRSGDWFLRLLLLVKGSYERNVRAEHFQAKYPDLSADELADKLISVATRYAAVAGGLSGVASSADELALVATGGIAWPLFIGAIGGEMIYLARLQMRLVLDLAVVYDLQLDPNDPEDVLMVFGYALGIAPVEALGQILQISGQAITKDAIRKYISKGTLKTIQDLGKKIGLKILQRNIIKYAIPIASIGVASTYNYTATQSIGKIAKIHFKNRQNPDEAAPLEESIPQEELSLDMIKILKVLTKKLRIPFPWKQIDMTTKALKSAAGLRRSPQKEGIKIPVTFEEDNSA